MSIIHEMRMESNSKIRLDHGRNVELRECIKYYKSITKRVLRG